MLREEAIPVVRFTHNTNTVCRQNIGFLYAKPGITEEQGGN
jgi:hypothetical protein